MRRPCQRRPLYRRGPPRGAGLAMIPDPLLAQTAAADSAALAAAAGSAEEALGCQRDALAALAAGWHSESGSDAIELLQRQCARATDIVAELHRAAVELRSLRDDLADLAGGSPAAGAAEAEEQRQAEASGPDPRAPVQAVIGDGPPPPADPPAVNPAQSLSATPWAAQAGAGTPTAGPPTAPQGSPPWQAGGSMPALPDLGGALVGLVAQIAQTLGSYADSAGPGPAEDPVAKPVPAEAEPRPPHRKAPVPVTSSAAEPILPDSAVPKSIAPQPQQQPPVQTPAPPSSDLLAAERPPGPGVPSEPPPPPVGAAPPQTPPAPMVPPPAPDPKTPCEIAADELPKVGE